LGNNERLEEFFFIKKQSSRGLGPSSIVVYTEPLLICREIYTLVIMSTSGI
jgi:hypothetical protein